MLRHGGRLGRVKTAMVLRVPVEGGELALHELTGPPPVGAPVVVALHGITANALSWVPVARQLDGQVRMLAPDLRGRAESRTITGPWGLAAHAADVISVLDAVGASQALVVGHSMGAFVAGLTAHRYPDRIASVVLADGGVGIPIPTGADIDAILEAVIGPAVNRLRMTFADPTAYLDFWRAHPALSDGFDSPWREDLVAALLHDLVGPSGAMRSSCVLDAVRADGSDVLSDPDVLDAVRGGTHPTVLLWAERGLMNEPQGLYDETRLAAAGLPDRVDIRAVPDVNHYTMLFEPHAVEAVAAAIMSPASSGTMR